MVASDFQFQVSVSSGTPIYRQIMDQVLILIASGRLEAGALLPSVRDVATHLQVNPMTVSKAYSLLERDGIVERVRGQGMRVNVPAQKGGLRERREQILPQMKQLVATAYQLGLSREQVLAMLEPLLKELSDGDESERSGRESDRVAGGPEVVSRKGRT
jgi:GntR family transcriptional regulator